MRLVGDANQAWEEVYSALARTICQRVRTAPGVPPRNLLKIQLQDMPSSLYASKAYLCSGNCALCFVVLERPCSSSVNDPSSLLLRLGSLSPKTPLSSLYDSSPVYSAIAL